MTMDENPLVALSNAMAEAAAKAGASTVLVDARRRLPASGIAYSAELILTADHVVERDDDLRVILPNGDEIAASLVGRDPGSDLALLRLPNPAALPAQPAEGPARIGQLALALGRPSREGLQASLGVVSAIGGPARTAGGGMLESYLRTDTIPYPGFSGGPLIDAAGRILGLNTSGLAQGMALTIPVGLAWKTAATLAAHGRVQRGYLGIRSQPVSLSSAQRLALGREQETGLLLVGIEDDSPAEQGGLLVGDILVALAGQPVRNPDELLATLAKAVVGQPAAAQALRGGQPITLMVTVGAR